MLVTLDTFAIANGTDRALQVLGEESFGLRQTTQTAVRARGEWLTGFYSRASRSIRRSYVVQFPPCASLQEAFEESLTIPLTCPRGGLLTEQVGAFEVTYADAWIDGEITVQRRGVSNLFTFPLTAINPSTATLSTLAQMDKRYIANLNTITGLTGGTATDLDGLVTTDVAVGFTAFVLATNGGVTQPKHFRLIAGTTAENTDPTAGLLVVRPDDYHAVSNAKVWVEVG